MSQALRTEVPALLLDLPGKIMDNASMFAMIPGGLIPFENFNNAFHTNAQNLNTISGGIFQDAASAYFGVKINAAQQFDCNIGGGSACTCSATCEMIGAGGWVIMNSIVGLGTFVNKMYTTLGLAIQAVSLLLGPNGQFIADFDPPPMSQINLELVLDLVSMLLGLLGGMGAPLFGAAMTIGTGTLSAVQTVIGNPTTPPDLPGLLSQIVTPIQQAYGSWANDMFFVGEHQLQQPDSNGDTYQSFGIIMADGNLLAAARMSEVTELQPTMEKALYAQLAQIVWSSSEGITPFITFDNFACGSGKTSILNSLHGIQFKVNLTDISVTIGSQCYYLLGATPGLCQNPITTRNMGGFESSFPCCSVEDLPGGTHTVLTGGSAYNAPYAGLLLEDFIMGSVNGWNANKKTNGYAAPTVSMDPNDFPKTVQDTGFVNLLPVCDYTLSNPGINCPELGNPQCTVATSSKAGSSKA
ncbi:hypothetical protein MMC17_004816 [Xylographa soralifera]|nr:hypothetical protein [Xylographa soralifera]